MTTEALMKRCQIGVTRGPNAYDNLHSILAECYGTLGAQATEIDRLRAEVAGLREALQMWLTLHDNPAGYAGKYGKALDAAIAAQQTKIDAAATAARTALAARKGEA